ncbi:very short patch repair endonuclease [Arsenicibacter rosenii]|uniref:Very short patch repair endonuclease n=1 Tax=Arsenicibacter rosenii TaxID=1750698 RepID=A0A1S2VAP7_9BACT|nr:very short patch repair endonuclease [Arsenicibacter rosenii]OIN55773.1 very short patch repair endonuclease [Arsenicibacter rosenii]
MADVVSPEKRSQMMAGIKGKNTKPEMAMRSALHRLGFRYKLHGKGMPGKPDVVFPKYRAVLLVHGCFWHGHSCHLFKWPSSRSEFWHTKINRNREVDRESAANLEQAGWRVGVVWECAVRGRVMLPFPDVVEAVGKWLQSEEPTLEIRGTL